MFEKEAEEYADLKCGKDNRKTTGWILTQDDFQKGAEFGYNKANESLSKRILELQADKGRLIDEINEAKKLIKNLIRVTWGEGWNYSLDWKVKAEAFLNKE